MILVSSVVFVPAVWRCLAAATYSTFPILSGTQWRHGLRCATILTSLLGSLFMCKVFGTLWGPCATVGFRFLALDRFKATG